MTYLLRDSLPDQEEVALSPWADLGLYSCLTYCLDEILLVISLAGLTITIRAADSIVVENLINLHLQTISVKFDCLYLFHIY